jgi:hypothetical protein
MDGFFNFNLLPEIKTPRHHPFLHDVDNFLHGLYQYFSSH